LDQQRYVIWIIWVLFIVKAAAAESPITASGTLLFGSGLTNKFVVVPFLIELFHHIDNHLYFPRGPCSLFEPDTRNGRIKEDYHQKK